MTENNKTIAKKILNIVLDVLIVILGIILLITIYNNIQIKILGNDYASFFGYSVFEVQTGSMEPEISAGDWIVVKYEKNIKLNDIVTFEHKGEFITHRVIEAYNETYVTKGDANNAKDSPVNKEQIVGTVTKILPNFGILRKTIFNPIVLIFLIITCYIGMQAFKKPSEKELAIEKELLEKIKNKVLPQKKQPQKEQVLETVQEEIKEEVKEEVVEELEPEEETKQEIKIEEILNLENEDEMEKTVFYRMVSVSEEELSSAYNTPVMIEENVEEPKIVEEEVIEVSEDEVKMTLELIQKKKKRCKNFMEKAIFIKKEELEEVINLLLQNEKAKPNEPTIKDFLLDSYIDAKYYNHCGEINLEYNTKNMNSRIEAALKELAEDMKKKYKGTDKAYKEKVDKFVNIVLLINYLEQDFKKEETTEAKKEAYIKRINKYFPIEMKDKELKALLSKVIKTQKKYNNIIKFLLSKLETGMFELKINNLTEKNTYAVELQHNIQFSKVYSEYIVDKTYSEGVVAEDKIEVLASLLQAQLVKDMFDGIFNKKYVVYIPETLYEKDNKIDKVLKMFDDPFAKNSINILVKFEALNPNKKVIKALVKEGYHFSTDMNNVEKIKKTEEPNLHIMDYIFITKTKATKTNILELIPEAVKSKITYDDIAAKVGNF